MCRLGGRIRSSLFFGTLIGLSLATQNSAFGRDANVAELSYSYLRQWSLDAEGAVQAVTDMYAPRIRFYGRTLDRVQLRREKLNHIRRWPIRSYVLRPDTVRVTCTSARCLLAGVMDWRVQRGTRVSQGASTFSQEFLLAPQPKIVSESGRVLVRN